MTAIEWLERCRRTSREIESVVREISALEHARDEMLPWRTGTGGQGHGQGSHSDPTATEAERRITELEEIIEGKRTRLDALQSIVGECLRVLEDMRRALSPTHADVCELYYVDCAHTWSEVTWELGVGRTKVWQIRVEAYAWIESHHQRFLRE